MSYSKYDVGIMFKFRNSKQVPYDYYEINNDIILSYEDETYRQEANVKGRIMSINIEDGIIIIKNTISFKLEIYHLSNIISIYHI